MGGTFGALGLLVLIAVIIGVAILIGKLTDGSSWKRKNKKKDKEMGKAKEYSKVPQNPINEEKENTKMMTEEPATKTVSKTTIGKDAPTVSRSTEKLRATAPLLKASEKKSESNVKTPTPNKSKKSTPTTSKASTVATPTEKKSKTPAKTPGKTPGKSEAKKGSKEAMKNSGDKKKGKDAKKTTKSDEPKSKDQKSAEGKKKKK